jgi:hypothetical protein
MPGGEHGGCRGWGQWVTILNKPYEPEAHVILRY